MTHAVKGFGNVLIIGLGMIGGSVAKALKDRGLATLYGADRREAELALGLSTGVIDFAVDLTPDLLSKMDVVILATPVRAMESVFAELRPMLRASTLVTDVGSTKGSVIDAVKRVFGELPANIIWAHPIAGAERSGVLAANPNLFKCHKVIVTPLPNSDPNLLDRLHRLWTALGAEVVSMDVEQHDHVLAASSHLPHLLAYTLVDSLANSDRRQDVFRFAAGGFRDFTRIASSDPTMWRDVFLANKAATLSTLDEFTARLAQMRQAIEAEDGASMFGVFTRAKSARDHFLRLLEERTMGVQEEIKPVSMVLPQLSSVKGTIALLGDKSLSHRAIAMAALAEGVSQLSNLDLSSRVRVTIQAFRDMGVVIEDLGGHKLRVHGVGLRGLNAPIAPINVRNSSISLYLLLPILAGQNFSVTLVGDACLANQPLDEVLSVVEAMGAEVTTAVGCCLPVSLVPKRQSMIPVVVNTQSARLRMAVIFAGLYETEKVSLVVNGHGRTHTEDLLKAFGCVTNKASEASVLPRDKALKATDIVLPADVTKSAWLILLATLLPGSYLQIANALVNETRTQYLDVLRRSGANIVTQEVTGDTPEVSECLAIRFAPLQAFELDAAETFSLRDELVLLCVAAVYAQGRSKIYGINELPFYCEDRLRILIDCLGQLGVSCLIGVDCIEIEGRIPLGGELECAGDYALALAQLALGARSVAPIRVNDCHVVFEEFAEFESVTELLGCQCSVAQ